MSLIKEGGLTRPEYRFKLRAKIAEAQFRTLTDFSRILGINVSQVSRVVSGWEWPSPKLQQDMAKALHVSFEEFQGLL
jgi:hypothetical protein